MTEEKPLVSVVMPNYNHGPYINEAILSVAQQTYTGPVELIVVDDGSKDYSPGLIADLQQRFKKNFVRFTAINLDQNGGNNHAINTGVKYVEGDITVILDADDVLTPDYLEKTTSKLLGGNPWLGFVYSDCTLIDIAGNKLTRGLSTSFDPELLKTKSYIPGCGATWTRALMPVMPQDESINVATKVYRWRAIVKNGWNGLHIPEPLFLYRMHDSNISGIGERVLDEVNEGDYTERILSGYWQEA